MWVVQSQKVLMKKINNNTIHFFRLCGHRNNSVRPGEIRVSIARYAAGAICLPIQVFLYCFSGVGAITPRCGLFWWIVE